VSPRASFRQWIDADRWGRGRPRRARIAILLIWVAFIVFPVIDAIAGGGGEPAHALAIAGAVLFTAGYVWLTLAWIDLPETRLTYGLCVGVGAIAAALTVGIDPSWVFLFTYVAACAGLIVPSPNGAWAVLATSVFAVLAATVGGDGGGAAIGAGASAAGVGLLLTLMRDLRVRNAELDEARAELARTAVAAERARFARDLHDLLGHSLSVIAIKAELAGRLLPGAPGLAAAEVADLETVARTALSEVREAVSGYRRPTLEDELEGARVALSAAGIIAEFDRSAATLAPEVEAVLAWAVREGATNVIRHSGARRCEVRVRAGDAAAAVEVVDDGPGGAATATGEYPAELAGNGLAGLRERAAAVRGCLEAGAVAGGGYRLSVSVPVPVSVAESQT
jgi:two-component system sensor histidine kinase DesK